MTPADFEIRVRKDPSGCWLWDRAIASQGYGVLWLDGRLQYAHRVAHVLFKGEIPEGLTIDHLCRVTACVNPEHLEAVTMRENILRGTAPAARHAKKTHCPQGHPLDGVTVRASGQRQRFCKACNRANAARIAARKKAAA